MKNSFFPRGITNLPAFEGPFDAFQLDARDCKVLFASYPAGTVIDTHTHETENFGIITAGELILTTDDGEQRFGVGAWYHLHPLQRHAAKFEQDSAEIEFWFDVSK